MALQNGRLPSNLLTSIDSSGRQLQIGAALRWASIQAEVQARYGWTPQLSAGATAYRTYEQQVALFTQRYSQINTGVDYRYWNGKNWWRKPGYSSAATPGTSNHGLGVAIDVAGLGSFGSPRYTQFAVVASRHGYNNNEGKRIREPWHWVYTGSNEPAPPPPEPKPKPEPKSLHLLLIEDEDMIERALQGAYRVYLGRTPSAAELDGRMVRIVDAADPLARARVEINGIRNSGEAVNYLYKTLLKRNASQAEITKQLADNGNDIARIENSIRNSQEYRNKNK